MTDSTREPQPGQPQDLTGIQRSARLDDPEAEFALDSISAREALESPESAEPVYVKEPLFSKKVMAAWAFLALTVWFAFTFIVPEIKAAVREAIVSAARESESNTATPPVPVEPVVVPTPAVPPAEAPPAPAGARGTRGPRR